ncbi:MAG TPA: endolytic transglycosylase MltG [Thermomicrobiales bacterium]|nr:endolytic transglycosylase MltG [Thermomicrobiales bacterium]
MVRVLTQSLKIVSIVVVAALVLGGSTWFFNYWQDRSRAEEIGRPVTIEVTADDDTGSVAEKLKDADLVRYSTYFETRMRFTGRELQPGLYTLRIGMSVPQIIDVISIPEPAGGSEEDPNATEPTKAFDVTFVEGQRIEQNAAVVQKAGLPNGAENYINAASDVENFRGSYGFLKDAPKGASLEGFLFPDTYTIGTGGGAADVIGYQLSNFDQQFTPEMRQQAADAGLSIYEAVTIASIVEREAVLPEERPIIAAVYLNRIKQDMTLDADPTIQYAVGTPDEWWPKLNTKLLQQGQDSPYNTYTHDGLPPGPIANPGFASLQAVLQPADVEYLFFVAKADGSGAHIFSNTYEEHQQNLCTEQPDAEDCQGGALPGGVPASERAKSPWDLAA